MYFLSFVFSFICIFFVFSSFVFHLYFLFYLYFCIFFHFCMMYKNKKILLRILILIIFKSFIYLIYLINLTVLLKNFRLNISKCFVKGLYKFFQHIFTWVLVQNIHIHIYLDILYSRNNVSTYTIGPLFSICDNDIICFPLGLLPGHMVKWYSHFRWN